jgi:hypothetical protein
MDFHFEQHATYLGVTASGSFDVDMAVKCFDDTLNICRASGTHRVLFNIERLVDYDSAVQRVLFAVQCQQHYQRYLSYGGQALRIAFLDCADKVTSFMPGLELARQNNAPVDHFTDVIAARAWLGV